MKEEFKLNCTNLDSIGNIGLHDAIVDRLDYNLEDRVITIDISLTWPSNLIPGVKNAKIIFSDVVSVKSTAYNPWFSSGNWINGVSVSGEIGPFVSQITEKLRYMLNTTYSQELKSKTEEELLNMNDFYADRSLYFQTEIEYHSGGITEIISKQLLYIEEEN